MTSPAIPHRTPTSGSEVVHLVEATFTALRSERDHAHELLGRVLAASSVHHLPPALVDEIRHTVTGT